MRACRGQEVIGMLARAALVTPMGRQGWAGIAVWTARTGLGRLAKAAGWGGWPGRCWSDGEGHPEVGLGRSGVTAGYRPEIGLDHPEVGLRPKSGPGPYFFLPATVLRAPRRVRALVRVR
jgi:hypothetical protein